jgi:hypothetical protein
MDTLMILIEEGFNLAFKFFDITDVNYILKRRYTLIFYLIFGWKMNYMADLVVLSF